MDSDEVAQRFTHFFFVFTDRHIAVVHPIVGEGLARFRFALCDFIFMMRGRSGPVHLHEYRLFLLNVWLP